MLAFVVAESMAAAQALPAMSRVRLPYVSRKGRVKPQGALKAQIDDIDAQLSAAVAAGNTSELRRLYLKGVVLLDGKVWTPKRWGC